MTGTFRTLTLCLTCTLLFISSNLMWWLVALSPFFSSENGSIQQLSMSSNTRQLVSNNQDSKLGSLLPGSFLCLHKNILFRWYVHAVHILSMSSVMYQSIFPLVSCWGYDIIWYRSILNVCSNCVDFLKTDLFIFLLLFHMTFSGDT